MKTKYFLLAVAAISMAACSNDESVEQVNDADVINFQASIDSPQTRADRDATDLQATYFETGEEVNIGIAPTSTTSYTYAVYTADAHATNANDFTLKGGETALRWPTSGNIDLVAFHPSTVTATTTEFPVQTNQSTSDDYRASDLMAATKLTNVAKTSSPVAFTFNHMLSKVVVNLTAGPGITSGDLAATTVEIKTIKTAAFDGTKWSAKDGESTEWITLGTGANTTAIIVPQIIDYTSTPIDFIRITVGTNSPVVWQTSVDRTFTANTINTYNLTINMSSITLTSTEIANWTSTGGDTDTDAVTL